MKSRWLLNLGLFLLVAGVALFLYLAPEQKESAPTEVKVSALDSSSITRIAIEFPAKLPVMLEKRDGQWFLTQPYAARASRAAVDKILAILGASSVDKFDAGDPARFGLDHPSLRLKLNDEEFAFGTFNPVNGQQYIAYRNSVYLVSTAYADAAATQVVELLDKNLLAPTEGIAGFDFSRLEQWESTGLRLERENGQWKVSIAGAKPSQNALNEWFGDHWGMLGATAVEPYKADRKTVYPSFEIKLKNGKTLHFDKVQESPELLLARPDEGMLYHFPQDLGFVLLNPPVGVPK